MPLFYFNTKIPTILNNTNLQNLTSSTDSQHIIGSLKILSLASMPLDSIDLDNNFHFNRTNSMLNKQNMDNGEELLIDDYELENIENMKEDIKSGFISESDLENETLKSKTEKNASSQNPKKFTSKIMSFIKKLRNENLMANNEIGQHDDVEEEDEEGFIYLLKSNSFITILFKYYFMQKKVNMTMSMTVLSKSVITTIVTRMIQMQTFTRLCRPVSQSWSRFLRIIAIQICEVWTLTAFFSRLKLRILRIKRTSRY